MRRLNFDDVVVVGGNLALASAAEVDALESRLWIRFPSGYRDYMERLGEGCLGGGTFVQIYPPWRIEKELVEWRRRIHKYWFWDESLELLPKDRAVECVILGDTGGGDELIFHPLRPDRLFVLPHDSDRAAKEAGSDLLEAIEWMCSSGELTEPFPDRKFEPFDTRKSEEEEQGSGADNVVDPEGESLDDIVELGKRWVDRHSARDKHAEKLEKVAKRWAEMGRRGAQPAGDFLSDKVEKELILEAIILTNSLQYEEGYLLRYSLIDSESRSKLGEFQCSGDPYVCPGYSYSSTSESGS